MSNYCATSLLQLYLLNMSVLAMNYFLYSEMTENADWNEENTRLLCELFAEQVRAHNRSGTHLNRTGYKNIMEKFKGKDWIGL
jgi:hypothetical protein